MWLSLSCAYCPHCLTEKNAFFLASAFELFSVLLRSPGQKEGEPTRTSRSFSLPSFLIILFCVFCGGQQGSCGYNTLLPRILEYTCLFSVCVCVFSFRVCSNVPCGYLDREREVVFSRLITRWWIQDKGVCDIVVGIRRPTTMVVVDSGEK